MAFIEIVLAIYGLFALLTGRMPISMTRSVVGRSARLLGLLALAPLPVVVAVIGVYLSQEEQFSERARAAFGAFEALAVGGTAILVFILGSRLAVDTEQIAQRTWDEDEKDGDGRDCKGSHPGSDNKRSA